MKILRDPALTWVNLDNPNADDIAWLQKEFDLHPLVIKDLNVSMRHPKIDVFGNYIFMALQIPIEKDGAGTALRIEELDIIMSQNWLISSHTSRLPFVSDFFAKCMASQDARKEYFKTGPAAVIEGLIAGLFESVNTEIDNIEGQIAVIEDEIFKGREQNMVFIISQTRRKVIDFLRTLEPMKVLFQDLLGAGSRMLGKEARPYLEYISESHAKIINILITQKETIAALEETNQSLLSTKTNAILKFLTVFTGIMLAPNTIAQIFATNVLGIPFSHSANGFLIVTAIIFGSGVLAYLFFKIKRWI